MSFIPYVFAGFTLVAAIVFIYLLYILHVEPFFKSSLRMMEDVSEIRSDSTWNRLHIERLTKELATYESNSFAAQLLDEVREMNKRLKAIESKLDSLEK